MLWFLRLFSAFRQLEALCVSETKFREREQSRADRLEAEVQRLNSALVEESHKVADVMALHGIGRRVYSKADPDPQQDFVPQHVGVGRTFARAEIARSRETVQSKLEEIWKSIEN